MSDVAPPFVNAPLVDRSRRRIMWSTWVLLAVIVLFAANTGWRIFALPMWGDEVRTWRDSYNKSYGEILTWRHNHDHAPLGHLLAKVSTDVFRTDAPWAVRLPSFLFGVACIPLGYLLGRLVWNRRAGAIIAVMIAVDVTVTFQSQIARMYTMLLAGLLATLCGGVWALRQPRPTSLSPADEPAPVDSRAEESTMLDYHGISPAFAGRAVEADADFTRTDWRTQIIKAVVIGLSLGLALWAHYAAVAVLITLLVTALILAARRDTRVRGLTLLAGVFIAAATATQGFIKLVGMAGREKLPYTKDRDTVEQLLVACQSLIGNSVIAIVLFALALYGLFLLTKRQPTVAWMLLGLTTFLVVNLVVAANYRHVEGSRYLVGFLPICWLGLAIVNDTLWNDRRRWLATGCIALFVIGTGYQLGRNLRADIHPQAYNLRDAAATLPKLGYQPGDRLVFAPVEPQRTSALYYDLDQSLSIQQRIFKAWQAGNVSRRTLGGGRPEVLWVVAVTPCREKQRGKLEDGLGQAQAAAVCYGQTLDAARMPSRWEERGMTILKLTPQSLELWSADGTPR